MKKSVIQTILGLITIISLGLVACEADTCQSQILWSGSWLLVCAISGTLMEKTFTDEDREEKA